MGIINFHTKTYVDSDSSFRFNGNFLFSNSQLKINLSSPTHPSRVDAEVTFLDKKPEYYVSFTDLHNVFKNFSETKNLKKIFNFDHTVFEINSQEKNTLISAVCKWNVQNGDPVRRANIICSLKSKKASKEISGEMMMMSGGKEYKFNLDLVKFPTILKLKHCDIKNVLLCSGEIDYKNANAINANIIFPNTPFQDLGRLIFSGPMLMEQGNLFGSIGIFGTLQNLQIMGKLNLVDLILNKVGIYDGVSSFKIIDKQIEKIIKN